MIITISNYKVIIDREDYQRIVENGRGTVPAAPEGLISLMICPGLLKRKSISIALLFLPLKILRLTIYQEINWIIEKTICGYVLGSKTQ